MATLTDMPIEKLEQERADTIAELANLREAIKARVDADIGQGDPESAERDKLVTLIRVQEHKLQALEHALDEARQGTYGTCEECGKPIDPERLAILPETTHCVDCQRIIEKQTPG